MKCFINNKLFLILFILGILIFPAIVLAHQPRIPERTETLVSDPEVSKAYYSMLNGQPHIYRIVADKPFALYINVLVPDIAGQKRDVSAVIIRDGNADQPIATLIGLNFEWKRFFEPFGHDTYLMGPEYRAEVGAGNYEIRVSSPNNDSKYSLAIGETEAFDLKETINAINLIPKIKRDFFNESPADFILSPFGAGYIIFIFILAFIVGFICRPIMKRVAKATPRGLPKNLGAKDRWVRFIIGVVLLILSITTTWNPILFFLSGFCFFEAIFSWCGLYAALGKNTCPVG